MLNITPISEDLYVGIDHSVNKSAVCVLDPRGNIIGAALFEKSTSSHKYTFSYYDENQKLASSEVMRIYGAKKTKGSCDHDEVKLLEKTSKNMITGKTDSEVEVLRHGLKSGVIYDEGEYTRTILICEYLRNREHYTYCRKYRLS
jgi:hypothetical protein